MQDITLRWATKVVEKNYGNVTVFTIYLTPSFVSNVSSDSSQIPPPQINVALVPLSDNSFGTIRYN